MSEYRDDARREVKRAKAELESGDDERLKYVALELRMAMESLVYDRALIYKDEFPPKEYETWQLSSRADNPGESRGPSAIFTITCTAVTV